MSPPASVDLPARLLKVIADPTFLIVLACADDKPAGLAVMQVATPDPLSDHQHIHLSHLVVSRTYRRRGMAARRRTRLEKTGERLSTSRRRRPATWAIR